MKERRMRMFGVLFSCIFTQDMNIIPTCHGMFVTYKNGIILIHLFAWDYMQLDD